MKKLGVLILLIMMAVGCVGCSNEASQMVKEANEASQMVKEAKEYYDSSNYEEAINAAKSVIKDYPDTRAATSAEEVIDEAINALLTQLQDEYEKGKWSSVLILNDQIIRADPKCDAVKTAQPLVSEARSNLQIEMDRKAAEREDEIKQRQEEEKQRQEKALSRLRSSYDKIQKTTWYEPKSAPKYINNNAFYIYMGASDGEYPYYWLRWKMVVCGSDWTFFDKVIINVDGENHYKNFDYYDVERDNEGYQVWEYVDIKVTDEDRAILDAIASSEETIIRFQGDSKYSDRTLTQVEIKDIKAILDVYDSMQK